MKYKILKLWRPAALALTLMGVAGTLSAQTVTTVGGGSGTAYPGPYWGYLNGQYTRFDQPSGLAMDPAGTILFIADYSNNVVRFMTNPGSSSRQTFTFTNPVNAGLTQGITNPIAVAVDLATNVYVLNRGNGTNGSLLQFNINYLGYPTLVVTNATHLTNASAMAVDGWTNIFVTVNSNTVLRISPTNTVSVVGVITNRGVNLDGIAVLDNGQLALSDAGTNSGIWLMNPYTNNPSLVTPLAGFNGTGDNSDVWPVPATNAIFNHPGNLAKAGNGVLVVTDNGNHRVKLLNTISSTVSLFYGVRSNLWLTGKTIIISGGSYKDPGGWVDGTAGILQGNAESRLPFGAAVAPDGTVYVSEDYCHVIRHITGTGLTGPVPGYPPLFKTPAGIALDAFGTNLFIADLTSNTVEQLNLGNNQTTTYLTAANGITNPASVLLDTNNNLYVLNQNAGTNGYILEFDSNTNAYGAIAAGFTNPTAFTMDGNGNFFIAEQTGAIKVYIPSTGNSKTIFTLATNASVQLEGIAILDNGNLAVSDAGNHVIWSVNPVTKTYSRLTGQFASPGMTLGTNRFAQLNQPHQLARSGGNLLVADSGNNRLVLVSTNGFESTNGLNSSSATIWFGNPNDPVTSTNSRFTTLLAPVGVAVSTAGIVYDSEPVNQVIRGFIPSVTAPPLPPPTVILPYFNNPAGIAFDAYGSGSPYGFNNLFIADTGNNAVEILDLDDNTTSTFLSVADGISNPVSVLVDTNEYIYVLNQNVSTNGYLAMYDIYGNYYGNIATNLNQPTAFTEDGYGNFFVTEQAGRIRAFGIGISNIMATITNANVSLQGLALFDDGTIAVSDAGNHVIWTVNIVKTNIAILTGQLGVSGTTFGPSNFAKLFQPHQLTRVGGNQIVVADYGNNRLLPISRAGAITRALNSTNASVWFGQTGDPIASSSPKFIPMVAPVGVAMGDSLVFGSETYYQDIRGLTGTGLTSPTFNPSVPLPTVSSPSGPGFITPLGLSYDPRDNYLYIADPSANAVKLLDLNSNLTALFLTATNGLDQPVSVIVDTNHFVPYIYVLNRGTAANGSITAFDFYGNSLGTNVTGLNQPAAFTEDGNGNFFVAEQGGAVRVFGAGVSNTIVTITNAGVSLQGIAIFDDGSLAVSDAGNQVIWNINTLTKTISLLTGQIGVSGSTIGASNFAKLYQPRQLARSGNDQILLADYGNNRLLTFNRNGYITNVLNADTNASIWFGQTGDPVNSSSPNFVSMIQPAGVAIGNNFVFDSENYYADIRGLPKASVTAPTFNPGVPLPYFTKPAGIGFNPRDNSLYIADPAANAVELLDLNSNLTSLFLTAADGLDQPVSVIVDTNHFIPYIYVLNQSTATNGSITAFDIYGNSEGTNVAGLNQPTAFTEDGYGNFFVAEQGGAVRVFGAGVSNTIVTITNAGVSLQGIAIFDDGSLAVSDAGNQVVWNINALTKTVSRLTGQIGIPGATLGSNNVAKLSIPQQLARAGNNQILVADYGNNRLLTVNRNGYITNVLNSSTATIWFGQAGDPIAADSPKFVPMVQPAGVAIGNGFVFDSETYYSDIRGLTGSSVTVATYNPGVPLPYFSGPAGIALNAGGTMLFATDPADNLINSLNLVNNLTSPYLDSSNALNVPVDVVLDNSDNLYVLNQGTGNNGFILEFDRFGNLLSTNATGLTNAVAMTIDTAGDIYVAEMGGEVRLVTAGGTNTLVTAVTNNASVQLGGIALLDDGTLTVSDTGNHVIWQIDRVSKVSSRFTGQIGQPGKILGAPAFAKLNQPKRMARAAGNLLVVADSGNNQIVVVDDTGAVTNALISTNGFVWFGQAGDPVNASYVPMSAPNGLAIGVAGAVFAAEENIYRDIRELTGTGLQQLVGGGGTSNGTNTVIIPPTITPNSGYYPMGQNILVGSPNPMVYYTTDGTEPTTNSKPVSIVGNIGSIHWFNTTNDLTFLKIKSFVGTNASATVSGQMVASNTIGILPDFNPMLQAGIGSSIVIPVVCNLATNQQIQSYQFRCEIYPLNNANTPAITPLNISPTNDFVPVVTAVQNDGSGSFTNSAYTLGDTNGLLISTAITNGNNGNTSFKNYAVVLMLKVQIPLAANVGDTYGLNILYPSATADGFNNTVPLTAMPPATIVVADIPYTAGDSASAAGGWYNAGTFGDGNLDNSDVNQAFYASSGLRTPYPFTDVFNAMDVYPPDGNGYVGGDGQIRFLDWQTILARSLRLDTNNWSRVWSAGGLLIDVTTNLIIPHVAQKPVVSKVQTITAPWYRQALVGGDSIGNASPGSTVSIPVYVKLQNGSTVSGLQFRAVVTPQNGAPAITSAPQLYLASGVTSPYLQQSFKAAETAFGWQLGSFSYQSRSSNFLGWVSFTIPDTAQSGQSYTVSFANPDGSPDLNTQYDFESRSATVSVGVAAPPQSITSDEWKIHFFGSTTNPAAADNADPDGDGVPNWMEFLAGTDPTSPQSKLQLGISGLANGTSAQLNWLTAPGHAYELQSSSSLTGGWTTIATVSGDGTVSSLSDTNLTGTSRYYRLHILQ